MKPKSLEEFMSRWFITGRITKVVTPYTGDENATRRQGTFEFKLDGVVYKGEASWDTESKQPTTLALLNDLRSMALACDNALSFEAWAKDLDYDTDSREAEAMYYIRCRETRRLETWLGTGRFRELLWKTKGL